MNLQPDIKVVVTASHRSRRVERAVAPHSRARLATAGVRQESRREEVKDLTVRLRFRTVRLREESLPATARTVGRSVGVTRRLELRFNIAVSAFRMKLDSIWRKVNLARHSEDLTRQGELSYAARDRAVNRANAALRHAQPGGGKPALFLSC